MVVVVVVVVVVIVAVVAVFVVAVVVVIVVWVVVVNVVTVVAVAVVVSFGGITLLNTMGPMFAMVILFQSSDMTEDAPPPICEPHLLFNTKLNIERSPGLQPSHVFPSGRAASQGWMVPTAIANAIPNTFTLPPAN